MAEVVGVVVGLRIQRMAHTSFLSIACSAFVFLLLLLGCSGHQSDAWTSDYQGSLSRDQAESLLSDAAVASGSSGYEPVTIWNCYFDRYPSGFLTALCGPVAVDGSGRGSNPGGPPYYLRFLFSAHESPTGPVLELEAGGTKPQLYSTENYPHVLFNLTERHVAP